MENGRKIDDRELYRLLTKENWTQREVARHFGVSDQAISQRVKALRITVSRHTGLERAKQITDLGIDIANQLQNVNDAINEELEWAIEEARKPEMNRLAFQENIVRLAGEIRKQLNFQIEVLKSLYDMKAISQFQNEVLSVINEV